MTSLRLALSLIRSLPSALLATTLALSLPPALHAQATKPATPAAPAREEAVQLEKFDVTADKENNFSLPLDAVATSGSRLGLSSRDLPASVSIITQEMMQLRGLRTAVEAVEAAVGMTGGTQFGSIPNYSTRGFGGNNVSIMRDGIRQNTASQSSRTVDSFILDRIEVLKGPDGLMFGEGAIGGAVNYISKSPSATFRGDAMASLGPWGSYRDGVGFGGPLAAPSEISNFKSQIPVTFRADYSHNQTNAYQERNSQRYDALALSVGWRVSEKLSLTWYGTFLDDWNESYYGNPTIYDAVVNTTIANAQPEVRTFNATTDRMINPHVDPAARRTNYNFFDNYATTENVFNRVRADLRLSPDLELRNETYVATQLLKWKNTESNTWNPVARNITRGGLTLIYRDDVIAGNRLDLTVKKRIAGHANRLLIGGVFEHNDQIRGGSPGNIVTTIPAVSLYNPNVGFGPASRFQKTSRIVVETHAFHAQDVFDVTSNFRAVAGVRYDHIALQRDTLANNTTAVPTAFSTFKKGYRTYTGRVGGVLILTKKINAYASFSRAAEPVTQLVSLTTTSADFSLQKGRQHEAGIKGTFLRGKLDATVAVFDLLKKDLLTSTLDPVTGLRISQQIGAQKSKGAEAALAISPGDGWRLELNGAFTDSTFSDFNENLGTSVISRTGKRPSNVPEWVANIFVAKRFANGLALSGGPRYVSDRFGNNNNSVVAEGYVTLDAAATYTWRKWHFTIRGRNLLDEEYESVAGTTMRRLADPRTAEFSTRVAF
ncbi:TonB-dependent receptor [Horticoccus sp. 23ND18S-11]|uniref:TonB-dependent receptor n=1 Tax=Horticoccus sp. 23ND18S-11 TaxID=3391832 RepID=UPI0039C96A32